LILSLLFLSSFYALFLGCKNVLPPGLSAGWSVLGGFHLQYSAFLPFSLNGINVVSTPFGDALILPSLSGLFFLKKEEETYSMR
jgi:hypothetical protein